MSTKLAVNRIKKELEDFKNSKDDGYGFEVDLINSNLFHLKAKLYGPPGKPDYYFFIFNKLKHI